MKVRLVHRLRMKWFRFWHLSRAPHDITARRSGAVLKMRSNSPLAQAWYTGLGFEDGEILCAVRLTRPGSRVMDVGANAGIYSVLLGRATGAAGHVWSFEPTPETATLLRENVSRNRLDNVTVVEQAVSDTEGKATFHLFDNGGDVYNSLGASHRPLEQLHALRTLEVAVTTLDVFADRESIPSVDVLKVDVEGAEERVLKGARRLLERSRNAAVLVELNESSAVQCGCSTERILGYMQTLGFLPYGIGQDGSLVTWIRDDAATSYVLFRRSAGEGSR